MLMTAVMRPDESKLAGRAEQSSRWLNENENETEKRRLQSACLSLSQRTLMWGWEQWMSAAPSGALKNGVND